MKIKLDYTGFWVRKHEGGFLGRRMFCAGMFCRVVKRNDLPDTFVLTVSKRYRPCAIKVTLRYGDFYNVNGYEITETPAEQLARKLLGKKQAVPLWLSIKACR